MAKDKPASAVDKDLTGDGPVKDLVEKYASVISDPPDPINEIAFALVNVAKGASVVALRQTVVTNAPTDIEGRKKYVGQLRRMRDAADTALVLAMELASGV